MSSPSPQLPLTTNRKVCRSPKVLTVIYIPSSPQILQLSLGDLLEIQTGNSEQFPAPSQSLWYNRRVNPQKAPFLENWMDGTSISYPRPHRMNWYALANAQLSAETQTNGVSFVGVRFWVPLHRSSPSAPSTQFCCPYQQKAPAVTSTEAPVFSCFSNAS